MTTLTGTPAPLEAYLRRATLGLPPERREEVWNELEEHVLCRAEQLEFQGHTPEQALKQALRELGPPLRVSAAMNGVHNMPRLIAFATLTTLAVSAGLYALAQQPVPTMQIPVQTQAPAVKCAKPSDPQPQLPLLFKSYGGNLCYQDDSRTVEGVYVSLSDVEKAVQPLGLNLAVKDGKVSFYYNPLQKQVAQANIYFRRDGESFLDAGGDLLPIIMSGFPVPTHLYGYAKPTLSVGNVSNIVLSDSTPDFGETLYGILGQAFGYRLFDFSLQGKYQQYGPEYNEPDAQTPVRKIQTALKPGEVVAVYQWTATKPKTYNDITYMVSNVTLDIGVTDTQSNVNLRIPDGAKFVSAPPTEPGNDVLLIKLTNTPLGDIKTGLFLPN